MSPRHHFTFVLYGMKNGVTEITEDGFENRTYELPDQSTQKSETGASTLVYKIEDNPPVPVAVLLALQVCLAKNINFELRRELYERPIVVVNVSFCAAMSVIVGTVLCADTEMVTQLTSSTIIMTGVGTIIQTSLGVRLPVFHGPNIAFLVPILNMAAFPEWSCPADTDSGNGTVLETGRSLNGTLSTETRLEMFTGSLLAASGVHVLLGASGLVGYISGFIGPLTVAPTIALIGIVIIDSAIELSSIHWGISLFTVANVVLMTSYLEKIRAPLPAWSRKTGWGVKHYPVFHVYAVVFATVLGFLMALVLTETGVLSENPGSYEFRARTDAKSDAINTASWLYIPYPGHFGGASFNLTLFVGMLVCVFMSVVESMGGFLANSRICGVPPPPPHAFNRGILVTGLCGLLSGGVAATHATTPSTANVSIIGLTKVASRLVFQLSGLFIIVLGIVGKFSAVFVAIPDPVYGGLTLVTIASLTGVGIASLNTVDLSLSRNFMTVGFSLVLGLLVPRWLQANTSKIDTGLRDADLFIMAVLGNSPFVGGLVGFLMDLTLPGQRSSFKDPSGREGKTANTTDEYKYTIYDLPIIPRIWFKRRWARYVPFLPSYYESEHDPS